MTLLLDKVAVITGGGTGIGRAISLRFGREGARLILVSNQDPEAVESVAAAIRNHGGEALGVQADVSIASDVQAMLQQAIDSYGRLDILINNAAYFPPRLAADALPESEWGRTLDVDLKGTFLGAKYGIPLMLATAGRGALVNVSSINSFIHAPGYPAYSAAKGGLDALTRQLALEYGPRGIRVNAVNPGLIAVESVRAELDDDPLEARLAAECYPLARVGEPEEVAAAVAFLASDEASFITGVTLSVDGGISIQSAAALLRPGLRRGWREGRLVIVNDET